MVSRHSTSAWRPGGRVSCGRSRSRDLLGVKLETYSGSTRRRSDRCIVVVLINTSSTPALGGGPRAPRGPLKMGRRAPRQGLQTETHPPPAATAALQNGNSTKLTYNTPSHRMCFQTHAGRLCSFQEGMRCQPRGLITGPTGSTASRKILRTDPRTIETRFRFATAGRGASSIMSASAGRAASSIMSASAGQAAAC